MFDIVCWRIQVGNEVHGKSEIASVHSSKKLIMVVKVGIDGGDFNEASVYIL